MADDWLTKLKDVRAARKRVDLERDELIIAAASAGVPKTHIADAVGLSSMQVHRILNAARARE
ncbi:hypothetical protein [Leifsonia poae]|uniref:hypothetical protein n=1 Tax=Leifsonia poae TaxID=110933 RepID=UPI001CBD948D|nr:hypothetical protein [Leifsonia poae]